MRCHAAAMSFSHSLSFVWLKAHTDGNVMSGKTNLSSIFTLLRVYLCEDTCLNCKGMFSNLAPNYFSKVYAAHFTGLGLKLTLVYTLHPPITCLYSLHIPWDYNTAGFDPLSGMHRIIAQVETPPKSAVVPSASL